MFRLWEMARRTLNPKILNNEINQNSRHKIQITIIVVSGSVIDADIFGVEILGYLD